MDLLEVNDQLVALSNIVTFQDVEITSLSNVIIDNETAIESLSNKYYPWKVSIDSKITTLQEIDLVFYDDLRNLHDEIDVVTANTSQNFQQHYIAFQEHFLYIPQFDKPDLITSAWVAPLQSDVKIS